MGTSSARFSPNFTLVSGIAVFAALAFVPAPAAAEPVRVDVFTAGSEGYAVYRIPGIVVTPKGALLAYAEARKTSGSDWDAIDLVMRRSEDNGASWSAQQVVGRVRDPIAKNPVAPGRRPGRPDALTYNNPVAIPDRKTGLVHFVFCVEYMRAFYMRSKDDGKTFSESVEITAAFDKFRPEYDWKVLATGPAHGLQLRNGRLLIPVWLSTSTGANAHHPSVAATIYSDDHGATWRRGDIAIRNSGDIIDPSETAAEQLADGRVMLNARSESKAHRRIVVESKDGATRWSAPRFQSELAEPICLGSLVRLGPASRRGPNRLLFVNPDNLLRGDRPGEPGQGRDRKNLTVQLSEDDGRTWTVKRVIDPGWSGYADIGAGPDGTIYCLYERGRPIAALTLVRFDLKWLKSGADATALR